MGAAKRGCAVRDVRRRVEAPGGGWQAEETPPEYPRGLFVWMIQQLGAKPHSKDIRVLSTLNFGRQGGS